MKILLANKFFYVKGGADSSFFCTARLLKDHGHKISFFSMQHPDNFDSEYSKYFVENRDLDDQSALNVLKASLNILYSFEAKRKIKNLVSVEKPDIAHLNNIYHQLSPSIIHVLKKKRIPIIMTLRDYKIVCASYSMIANGKVCERCKDGRYISCLFQKCVKDSRLKSLLNTFEMYLHHKILRIYDLVDVFISPSLFLKNKVEEMGFRGKVVYLPNFVSLGEYRPQYQSKETSFVYFGRLSKEKGLFTLIEAMNGLEAKLKIIGEGPLREVLVDRVKAVGEKNIEFLGYKMGEELKKELQNSIAVVVPSEWYENNPRSVIEAFACGKPVIGARIGGIPELVRDNETGLTFESGNVDDLREKIQKLIGNPQRCNEMGKAARKRVEQKWGEESHYQKLMEIYSAAVN